VLGAEARVVQRATSMQFFVEPLDDRAREEAPPAEKQQVDSQALRILATWIARRAGRDPKLGATIHRAFVVG
jgi:hypothetical protein